MTLAEGKTRPAWLFQLVAVLNILCWIPLALYSMLSVMACDAGCSGAAERILTLLIYFGVLGPPVATYFALREARGRRRRWVFRLVLSPVIYALLVGCFIGALIMMEGT